MLSSEPQVLYSFEMANLAVGTSLVLLTGLGTAYYFGMLGDDIQKSAEQNAQSHPINAQTRQENIETNQFFVEGVKDNNAKIDNLVDDLLKRGKTGRRGRGPPIKLKGGRSGSYKDYDEDYEDMIDMDE